MDTPALTLPNNEKKLLLHCCCAPCSGGIIELLWRSGIDLTVYFYNPNIHPKEEYDKRKKEIVRYCEKLKIPFLDSDYDPDNWLKRVDGLEHEPERGRRCDVCFNMRLERSALYAHENGFPVFSSTFGISRWKDMAQVNAAGMSAAQRYPDLIYWPYNWRQDNGQLLMVNIAKREEFYLQKYCGCIYSMQNPDFSLEDLTRSSDPAPKP